MFSSPEVGGMVGDPAEIAAPEAALPSPEETAQGAPEREPFKLGEHAQASRDRWDVHIKGLQGLLDPVVVPPPNSDPSATN